MCKNFDYSFSGYLLAKCPVVHRLMGGGLVTLARLETFAALWICLTASSHSPAHFQPGEMLSLSTQQSAANFRWSKLCLEFIRQQSTTTRHHVASSHLISHAMPSPIDNSFHQALANFSKRLTKQELEDFRFSSLSDVLVAVDGIQVRDKCPNSHGTMCWIWPN